MVSLTLELEEEEAREMQEAVKAGGFSDAAALVHEALRRFLHLHSAELEEQFLKKDVEWVAWQRLSATWLQTLGR